MPSSAGSTDLDNRRRRGPRHRWMVATYVRRSTCPACDGCSHYWTATGFGTRSRLAAGTGAGVLSVSDWHVAPPDASLFRDLFIELTYHRARLPFSGWAWAVLKVSARGNRQVCGHAFVMRCMVNIEARGCAVAPSLRYPSGCQESRRQSGRCRWHCPHHTEHEENIAWRDCLRYGSYGPSWRELSQR